MWDIIQQNKRRSWILLAAMALILLGLGYVVGIALHANFFAGRQVARGAQAYTDLLNQAADGGEVNPDFFHWVQQPENLFNGGGVIGAGIALCVWCIMAAFAFWGGESAIIRVARGLPVTPEAAPKLWNVVEEMTIAAGLPKPPDVYLIEDESPNAFAVGMNPASASVAVTSGLVRRMSRDELQGVVAHEIAHIHNYDTRFMTLASVMLGSIAFLSEVVLRVAWHSSGRRSSSSSNKGGGGAIVLLLFALIFAVLAPIAAQLLYFASSRRREYLADACAARFTRYPPGLASALEKIGRSAGDMKGVSRGTAALYIVNPLQSTTSSTLFSSHPPLEKRIAVLRGMAGAGYVDYERAYQNVTHTTQNCMDPEFLKKETTLRMRQPAADADSNSPDTRDLSSEALSLIGRAASLITLSCDCGAKLKLPPHMSGEAFKCPRCAAMHTIPRARPASAPPSASRAVGAFSYERSGTSWESFQCPCGSNIELGPTFCAKHASCRKCGRHIEIVPTN